MEPCTAKSLGEKGNHLLSMEKLENSGIVVVLWRDLMLEFAGTPRSREKDLLQEKFLHRYQSLMWEAGISTGSFYHGPAGRIPTGISGSEPFVGMEKWRWGSR